MAGYRTRRYHALLLTATTPPTGRVALVNGIEAFVTSGNATWPLSTQHYGPDVVYPRGLDGMVTFAAEPWPTWTFRGPDGTTITQEILVAHDGGDVLLAPLAASREVRGLGHVSEIADGDPPHTLRGCPFQAWSLSEFIRAQRRTAPR